MKTEESLLSTMDGKIWAEEFCKRFPQCAVDDVLGWFCNAIMAGHNRGWNDKAKAERMLKPSRE